MKSTIVNPAGLQDLELLRQVPLESALVIDFGDAAFDPVLVRSARQRGYQVSVYRVDLDPKTPERLGAFVDPETLTLGVLKRRATAEELLRIATMVRGKRLRVQMPLHEEADLVAFRILSSLGVFTSFDLRQLRDHAELAQELSLDAQLSLSPRGAVTPLEEIQRGFNDESFEISSLDLCANDYYVDLREITQISGPEGWSTEVDVEAKRIPFLLERHPCAFCEGLMVCHGYLYSEPGTPECTKFFADFMILRGARLKRDSERDAAKPQRGNTPC